MCRPTGTLYGALHGESGFAEIVTLEQLVSGLNLDGIHGRTHNKRVEFKIRKVHCETIDD